MASAWTGSELLVWGGWSGTYEYEFAEAFLGDGAAYDPVTDSWWMPTGALLHTPRTSPPPFGGPMKLSCPGRSPGSPL